MEKGSKVIIKFNPHDERAQDILATVVKYMPGEGLGGCDLVDVEYIHPETGETHVYPIRSESLQAVTKESLIALAEKYDGMAAEMRAMADRL